MEENEKDYSLDQVLKWLDAFDKDEVYKELKDLYVKKSYAEILSVGRRELSHSSFLAWLFDPNASHGLGVFGLSQLLKILVKRDHQQVNREKGENNMLEIDHYLVEIINGQVEFSDVKVKREVVITEGRPDIIIDCNTNLSDNHKLLHIVIENKVYSQENGKDGDQTKSYYKHRKVFGKEEDLFFFVYLTPKPNEELDKQLEPSCSDKHFIEINYQDILDDILEPALNCEITERTKFILNEYIQCLGMPTLNIDDKDKKKGNNKKLMKTIMATSTKTSELLSAFWEKHEDLLMAVLNNIALDLNQEPEVRDIAKQSTQVISSSGSKDTTYYSFDGKTLKGKYVLVSAIVKMLLEKEVKHSAINKLFKEIVEKTKKENLKNYTIKSHESEYNDKEFNTEKNKLKSKKLVYASDDEKYKDLRQAYDKGMEKYNENQKKFDNGEITEEDLKKSKPNQNIVHNYNTLEINNQTYYCYNQWGWKNIDFIIHFYNEYKKDKEGYPEITIIPN